MQKNFRLCLYLFALSQTSGTQVVMKLGKTTGKHPSWTPTKVFFKNTAVCSPSA